MIHFNYPDERDWLHDIPGIVESFTHDPDLVTCPECAALLVEVAE